MRITLRRTVAVLVLMAVGCGQTEGPPVAVSGRVLYRGVPIPSGTIVFTPDPQRGGHGPQAWAEIHDGQYHLQTGPENGAVPGWHRITVAPLPVAAPAGADPFPPLPARYRDPQLSQLRREVTAGKENVVDLNLD
jgi:hypothetical protein